MNKSQAFGLAIVYNLMNNAFEIYKAEFGGERISIVVGNGRQGGFAISISRTDPSDVALAGISSATQEPEWQDFADITPESIGLDAPSFQILVREIGRAARGAG
jgi:hypothetical protein